MGKMDYKKEYEELQRLWHQANKVYKDTQTNKDQASRLRKIARILGFTTGKRPVDIPRQKLLTEYRSLFAERAQTKKTTKDEKKKIVNDMAKKYGTSYEAIHKKLRLAISDHRKAIQQVYETRPGELNKALSLFHNILPPHK